MKQLLPILLIVALSTIISCKSDRSNGNDDSSGIDPKAFGTWKAVGDPDYMRIEKDGTFAFLESPSSEPMREGAWQVVGDSVIEIQLDWLKDAERLTDKTEEIKAFVEREPEARFNKDRFGITIDKVGLLLMKGANGHIVAWERVK